MAKAVAVAFLLLVCVMLYLVLVNIILPYDQMMSVVPPIIP